MPRLSFRSLITSIPSTGSSSLVLDVVEWTTTTTTTSSPPLPSPLPPALKQPQHREWGVASLVLILTTHLPVCLYGERWLRAHAAHLFGHHCIRLMLHPQHRYTAVIIRMTMPKFEGECERFVLRYFRM
ncbi:hypothetical protein Aduo_007954 [Ancylostoma duodenale]